MSLLFSHVGPLYPQAPCFSVEEGPFSYMTVCFSYLGMRFLHFPPIEVSAGSLEKGRSVHHVATITPVYQDL